MNRRPSLQLRAFRLPIVVIGGLLVLQSSSELDAPKLLYLAIALPAFGLAARNVFFGDARELGRRYALLFRVDFILVGLLALSYLVSLIQGTPTVDWFRDVLSYGLLAAAPVLALDAAATAPRWFLSAFLVVVGLLASVSTAVAWIERRGIADLPLDRLLWPAGNLALALYAFALGAAITRKSSVAWTCAAATVLALTFATGSRSSVLMLVVPITIFLITWRSGPVRALTIVGAHVGLAIILFGALELGLNLPTSSVSGSPSPSMAVASPSAAVASQSTAVASSSAAVESAGEEASPSAQSQTALDRLRTVEGLASDQSLQERAAQYRAAWGLFIESPLIGVGPGHPIHWIDVSGYSRDDFTADTPLTLPAKFGVVGLAVAGTLLFAYGSLARGLGRRTSWPAEPLALFAFGVYAVLIIPLGMPVEDKSFSFALALLMALAVGSDRDQAEIHGARHQQS